MSHGPGQMSHGPPTGGGCHMGRGLPPPRWRFGWGRAHARGLRGPLPCPASTGTVIPRGPDMGTPPASLSAAAGHGGRVGRGGGLQGPGIPPTPSPWYPPLLSPFSIPPPPSGSGRVHRQTLDGPSRCPPASVRTAPSLHSCVRWGLALGAWGGRGWGGGYVGLWGMGSKGGGHTVGEGVGGVRDAIVPAPEGVP